MGVTTQSGHDSHSSVGSVVMRPGLVTLCSSQLNVLIERLSRGAWMATSARISAARVPLGQRHGPSSSTGWAPHIGW